MVFIQNLVEYDLNGSYRYIPGTNEQFITAYRGTNEILINHVDWSNSSFSWSSSIDCLSTLCTIYTVPFIVVDPDINFGFYTQQLLDNGIIYEFEIDTGAIVNTVDGDRFFGLDFGGETDITVTSSDQVINDKVYLSYGVGSSANLIYVYDVITHTFTTKYDTGIALYTWVTSTQNALLFTGQIESNGASVIKKFKDLDRDTGDLALTELTMDITDGYGSFSYIVDNSVTVLTPTTSSLIVPDTSISGYIIEAEAEAEVDYPAYDYISDLYNPETE